MSTKRKKTKGSPVPRQRLHARFNGEFLEDGQFPLRVRELLRLAAAKGLPELPEYRASHPEWGVGVTAMLGSGDVAQMNMPFFPMNSDEWEAMQWYLLGQIELQHGPGSIAAYISQRWWPLEATPEAYPGLPEGAVLFSPGST